MLELLYPFLCRHLFRDEINRRHRRYVPGLWDIIIDNFKSFGFSKQTRVTQEQQLFTISLQTTQKYMQHNP